MLYLLNEWRRGDLYNTYVVDSPNLPSAIVRVEDHYADVMPPGTRADSEEGTAAYWLFSEDVAYKEGVQYYLSLRPATILGSS